MSETMNKKVILMVEDERMVARGIRRMVREALGTDTITLDHVQSLEAAQAYLTTNRIDLLLLDLNLHGADGFELLSDIASNAFQTIIVSANTDRALQSYEYGVLDFVPKPVGHERLAKALARWEGGLDDASRNGTGCGSAAFLSVKAASRTRILAVGDVVSIETAGKYSEIFMSDGSSHLHEKSLMALLQILPVNFQRIHRSTIVNLERATHLASFEGSRYELQMKQGQMFRVGRAFVKKVRERLK